MPITIEPHKPLANLQPMLLKAIPDAEERRVVARLIAILLDRGFAVRVHDGEEWAMTAPSFAPAAICKEVAATDRTVLAVYGTNMKRIGTFDLVHGNGEDVIHDHTAGDLWNEVFETAIAG